MADILTKKEKLIKSSLRAITAITDAGDILTRDIDMLIDNGNQEGGEDPITVTDLLSFGINYDKFEEAKVFIDNFNIMLDSGEPASKDYRRILNRLRTVA